MNPPSDPERLLDDLLDENANLRATSLDALLREAQRHRQFRRRRRTLLVVALAALGVTAVFWEPWQSGRGPFVRGTPSPVPDALSFVSSAPLPASMLVETTPSSMTVIRSAASSVAQIETSRDIPLLREIGDGELFTLLAGRPAALVHFKSGPTELLLLDAEGWTGLPDQ